MRHLGRTPERKLSLIHMFIAFSMDDRDLRTVHARSLRNSLSGSVHSLNDLSPQQCGFFGGLGATPPMQTRLWAMSRLLAYRLRLDKHFAGASSINRTIAESLSPLVNLKAAMAMLSEMMATVSIRRLAWHQTARVCRSPVGVFSGHVRSMRADELSNKPCSTNVSPMCMIR